MHRLVALALAALVAQPALAEDIRRGQVSFQSHCATCHGPAARGDGPMASVLSIPPADLTQLAADNGGTFPMARVIRRIDGTTEVLAHGGPMPLFGLLLDGPSDVVLAPDGSEVVASESIVNIAAWLMSVQAD